MCKIIRLRALHIVAGLLILVAAVNSGNREVAVTDNLKLFHEQNVKSNTVELLKYDRASSIHFSPIFFTLYDRPSSFDTRLFAYVGKPRFGDDSLSSDAAVWENRIAINFAVLSSREPVTFRLRNNIEYTAVMDAIEIRTPDDYTWRGTIEGKTEWSVRLTVNKNTASGLIHSPEGIFEIIPQDLNDHVLAELDQSRFLECGYHPGSVRTGSLEVPERTTINDETGFDSLAPNDTEAFIDVLVYYTPALRNALGGVTQAEAFVQSAIDDANLAYSNSSIPTRLRLVSTQPITYSESGNLGTDLDWITSSSVAAGARNTYNADLVALIVENAADACGTAWAMNSVDYGFEQYGFSVSKRSCAVGNHSFAHEIGHNQGCHHDPDNADPPSQLAYPFAYGHFVNGSFRTVMSYDNYCTGCPRVPYFSNPSVLYNDTATGVVNHKDNARVIRNTAFTVANFRDASGCAFRVGSSTTGGELTSMQATFVGAGGTAILGCPTAAVRFDGFTSFAGTTGHYQFLSSGELIYHTNNNRAGQSYAMNGPFRSKWASFAFNANHPLGYPIGNMSAASAACDGTINRYQSFEGGSLVQHLSGPRNGQAFEVHGAIHRRWELSGFAGCPLGLPTSDETTAQPSGASGSTGKLNQFQGGQIYWKTGAAAAYQVHGAIYQLYTSPALGGSAGWLGFPVSNEYLVNGRARSDFEGGYITTLDGTNYQAFTYSGCPRSATVSPTSGPIGTTVSITGDNFNGVGAVRFGNNAAATFTVNSSDRITATVPSGAFTGPIAVVKGGCANVSTGTFTVNASNTPTLQFSATAYSVGEGDGVAVITVNRSGGTGTLGVSYATSNGTATAGSDYTATSGVLSFSAAETFKTFTVPITNDTAVEGSETVLLTLSAPTGGAILGSPDTAILTIADNDSSCSYSVSPATANFTSASGSGSFTVTAGAGCTWSASVNAPSLAETLFIPIPIARSLFESEATSLSPQAVFLNSGSISVTDRPASGGPGLGSLYPSSIAVSGMTGSVSSVDVTLNNVAHPYPDDLDIVLVGPGGQRSVLMSDAGGASDLANVNLTFAQGASGAVSDTGPIGSGTYRPANYPGPSTLEPNAVDNFPSPGPGQGNFTADLTAFNGSTPNGTWRLYIVDDENLDTGTVAGGWALGITTAGGGTSWINVTSGSSGVGNGTVNYSVNSNSTGGARTGSITVNGQVHSVTQSGTGTVCPSSAITIGPIFNGTLSTSDCVLPGSTRYFDAYTFSGTQGQQVGINVTSSAFDTYVYLLNSSGTVLDEDDNSGPGSSSRIPASSGFLTLPSTGTYTIRAASAANGAAGAYTVSIDRCTYSLSTNETTISPGSGGLAVLMDTLTGCNWTAVSDSTSWLTTTSAGPGDGRVEASFLANPTMSPRTGRITVGGQVLTVTQIGIGGAGTVQLAVAVQSVDEAAGVATIAVTRVGGTGTGSVQYATEDGTATAGSDYTAANGTVLIVSDWTGTTFDVPILEDSALEGPETFTIRLFNQSSSFFLGSPTTMTVTISDNEPPVWANKPFDFDGDGKTDVSIFRPGVGEWWFLKSSDGGNGAAQFGSATDTIVPADYTGDGKTDMAFFRPGTGEWYVLRSNDFTFYSFPFGTGTDVTVPADYDGDGKADAAVFRPSNSTWYIFRSSDNGTTIETFGAAGDKPVPADYDGDNKADIAIYRPSVGEWWLNRSTDGVIAAQFGNSTDKLVQGDYTGDGKADIAFFRPSSGEWFILRSEDSSFYSFPFGLGTDTPAPGDYDGDGKIDAAVFRNSNKTWYANGSTAGTIITTFGSPGDRPVPNAFVR